MKKAPPEQCLCILVGTSGLEPPTPTMSRWCSNQLSYAPEVFTSSRTLYQEILVMQAVVKQSGQVCIIF
jgi:hypothetical protein